MTHADLVDLARRWLSRPTVNNAAREGHGGCSIVLTELVSASVTGEIPDAIGWDYRGSILVECKTSRADFLADRRKLFRTSLMSDTGMGRQRWFLVPKGLVVVEDLPQGWGLLEAGGRGLHVVRPSASFAYNARAEVDLLLSAMRRLKIAPDGHVSIRVYHGETKNKATLTIAEAEA